MAGIMSIRNYRDLLVWQKSMDLVEQVYRAVSLIGGHPYHRE